MAFSTLGPLVLFFALVFNFLYFCRFPFQPLAPPSLGPFGRLSRALLTPELGFISEKKKEKKDQSLAFPASLLRLYPL